MSKLPPLEKVQLQTISTCNANCVICPYTESWHKANPGRMKKSLYNKILNELEDFKTFEIFCPYLMNEPLTDTRIFTWIDDFYEMYPDKHVELSINPSLLSSKNRKKILKTFKDKKHIVSVSFHGMNEVSFNHIMDLSYNPCLNNMVKFLKSTQDDINIIIRGAGVSLDNKIYYFDSGHYISFWRDIFRGHKIDPEKVGVQFFSFHDRTGQIDRTERDANKNKYKQLRKIDQDNPFDCVRFEKVLHVLYNGDVCACCMDYKKEIDFLGNLNDMTLKEYYISEPYLQWVGMGRGTVESPPGYMCKRCVSPGG